MKTSTAVAAVLAIAAGVALETPPLYAQTVDAGVVIQSGPVVGHVVIGEPPPVVVHEAPVREVIVVEHVHVPHGNAYGWWKHHGYRPVTLYYDGERYYAHPVEGDVRLREVIVYQRQGGYYDAWPDRGHGHRRHGEDDDD